MEHQLFICTTCASVWQDGKTVGISGGTHLLRELSELHKNWELNTQFPLKPVACMSACNRSCTVSFVANGKFTYLFGDLPSNAEKLIETSQAILDCANLYYQKADGLLSWNERPEPLKKGILAKIPPA